MKVLIVGSEGFIGSNLCNYFLYKGFEVYGVDILEPNFNFKYFYKKVSRFSTELDDFIAQKSFDLCINAAGSGNVQNSVNYPFVDFEANTFDVIRILDALRKFNPKCKYLHISSAAVYGNPESLPISEHFKLAPVSPYGYHKLMSEYICKEYQHLFGLSTAVVRPFSVYGNGLRKQLFWDISKKIYDSTDGNIILFGTGEESRDFIHINDLVELIFIITSQSPFEFNIYNAASGQETTIKEVVNIIEKYIPSLNIKFSGKTRHGDPNNWLANISMVTQMGFSPKVLMESGIKEYLVWFKKNWLNGE